MFRRLKNFVLMLKEVSKKRGLRYIVFYGPRVFYYTYLKTPKTFVFQGMTYNYFYHIYNFTCLNERAVELPIVWKFIEEYKNKRVLEVGNVLSHYFPFQHDIVDRYEKGEGVINEDIIDFRPPQKYDLIIAISTLEHVGWDEKPKNPRKILLAFESLKRHLAPKGKMIVSLPLGYNTALDRFLEEEKIKFTKKYYLKRIDGTNEWKEVGWNDVRGIEYNTVLHSANALVVGIIEDS